jgi:hypothetical protein
MSKNLAFPMLEQLLEPVSASLNREAAEKLVRLRVNARTQAHIDRLARKCNEGKLTDAERAEYEACVTAIDFVAILQAKARYHFSRSGTS